MNTTSVEKGKGKSSPRITKIDLKPSKKLIIKQKSKALKSIEDRSEKFGLATTTSFNTSTRQVNFHRGANGPTTSVPPH